MPGDIRICSHRNWQLSEKLQLPSFCVRACLCVRVCRAVYSLTRCLQEFSPRRGGMRDSREKAAPRARSFGPC